MNTKSKLITGDFFASNPVFSLDEATESLGVPRGRTGTVERLRHHLKTGRLTLVTRQVYAVVPPGITTSGFHPDPFLVALAARSDAIFSYHSALELLGAAHSAWSQCTVFCAQRRRPLVMGSASIQFLQHPDSFTDAQTRSLGTRRVERQGRLLTVTGPERTLVEGFRRPSLCGGAEELIQSAAGLPVLDLDMLTEVLRVYDTAILWSAVGWFLERFQQNFHVPESVLQEMEKRRPRSPRYLERTRRGGVLAPRWNLILPETIVKRSDSGES